MKNRRILAALVGAVAILAAALLLRRNTEESRVDLAAHQSKSAQVQSVFESQSTKFQNLTPDERETKIVDVLKQLGSRFIA